MSPTTDPPVVHIFYDYVCPYAYVGKLRADELAREHDLDIRWLPWEIYPNAIPEGEEVAFEAPDSYTGWVEEMAAEMGEELSGPEMAVNSNLALRGAIYAMEQGEEVFEAYHTAVFEAAWSKAQNIGDKDVLREIVDGIDGLEPEAFFENIGHHAYQWQLDQIDQVAEHEVGVQRVPTFVFGDQRIVGNDRFEPSLKQPLEAFLERRKSIGEDWTTTLDWDLDLGRLLS